MKTKPAPHFSYCVSEGMSLVGHSCASMKVQFASLDLMALDQWHLHSELCDPV